MFGFKTIKEIDSKMNYILGYRQLVNVSVLAIAYIAYTMGIFEVTIILMILGLKWYISQAYHNFDSLEAMDLLRP